ncbi:hypothetical protein [Brucella sp. IR073]|uniref:hypothetical protein n=1 Tax=unclassified Brucella TaxID=2632610 RepID=UPI003B983524
MNNDERKLTREIFEYGEIERDAARTADFTRHGGLWFRFFKWIERVCREEREARIEERKIAKGGERP